MRMPDVETVPKKRYGTSDKNEGSWRRKSRHTKANRVTHKHTFTVKPGDGYSKFTSRKFSSPQVETSVPYT